MKTEKYYSIAEAAVKLGMTRAGVHAAIRQKRLKAKRGTFEVERVVKTKVKGWVIDEAELNSYQLSPHHQEAGKKNE
jgi:DNA-directed RNA polymerase specialized sigma54-like protein